MRFLLLVIDDENTPARENEMANIGQFNNRLKQDGHFVMAEGIHSGAQATVVDNRDGVGVIAPGSLYTEAEKYTGFWIIDAADSDQALELATQASEACNRKVELRPFLQPSG